MADDKEVDEVLDESVEDDEGLYEMGESSLTYFGADFDINGLVRRLKEEDIVVPRFDPDESVGAQLDGFQRQRVWSKAKMEQFIESLLLGWPVPSIFLVLDPDQRYLVLDGQQRLTALQAFFDGRYPDGKVFELAEVAEHLQGATFETLSPESRRRLNNTFIQATVIEPKGDDGPESVYRLFGRLNSGGVTLTPQEIRVALFRGPIVDWIRTLNHDENWRHLFGKPHLRLKDHELILRSFALRDFLELADGNWEDDDVLRDAYKPPMSEYLNAFLKVHRDLSGLDTRVLSESFASSTELLFKASGSDGLKFDGRVNAAHVDALLATLMWLHQQENPPSVQDLKRGLSVLRESETYQEFVTRSTSHRESVKGRLREVLNAMNPP